MDGWQILELGESFAEDAHGLVERAPPARGICGTGRTSAPPGFFSMLSVCFIDDECPRCGALAATAARCDAVEGESCSEGAAPSTRVLSAA